MSLFDQGRIFAVFMETGGCDVTGVLLSNQRCYIKYAGIFAAAVYFWRQFPAAVEDALCPVNTQPHNTVKVKGKAVPVIATESY